MCTVYGFMSVFENESLSATVWKHGNAHVSTIQREGNYRDVWLCGSAQKKKLFSSKIEQKKCIHCYLIDNVRATSGCLVNYSFQEKE